MALAQWQALAQQAGDGVGAVGQADGRGFGAALHATQRAADGPIVEYVLAAMAFAQLATAALDPALQSRPLLAHAQRGVAQRGRIADHQQVTVVQVLAAAHLSIGQGRGHAQPLQQGLFALEIGSHHQHACHPCSPGDRLPGGLASPRLGHRHARPS